MRIVGSLTTIPDRYSKLLNTLKSLKSQDHPLDAIYLGIPKISYRSHKPYPPLPDDIKQLSTVIYCDYDYGPCTKIIGALLNEEDPDTIILTFDDDIIYPPNLISNMIIQHNKYPKSAIGSNGILLKYKFPFYSIINNKGNLPKNGRPVDVLCSFSSVLYLRGFFPIKTELYDKFLKYPLSDENIYFNDDIMISAYLSSLNIERLVTPNIPIPNVDFDQLDQNKISYNKYEYIQRFRKAINKLKDLGFFTETQPVAFDETIGGNISIVVIFILLLLIVILLFFSIQY